MDNERYIRPLTAAERAHYAAMLRQRGALSASRLDALGFHHAAAAQRERNGHGR